MANRIRLGELLVRAGVIDDMQLKAALAEQHRWGGRLGRVLVDMAFVSEEVLVKALSKQLGVERADLTNIDVPQSILDTIPTDFAQQNSLCPVRYDGRRRVLQVATADPTNVAALDELRFKTGLRVETALAGEGEIHVAIQRHLRGAHGIDFDMPDAIELSDDDGSQVFTGNDDFNAAMAASGIPVLSGRPGAGVPTPDGPARAVTAPRPSLSPIPTPGAMQPVAPPAASMAPTARGIPGAPVPGRPSSGPVPSVPPPPSMAPPPSMVPQSPVQGVEAASGSAADMATRLEGAQKQQQRALRAMVELLIEKGVISREEYLTRVTPKR